MDEFLANLRASRLLSPDEWAVVRRDWEQSRALISQSDSAAPRALEPPSPVDFANRLVQRGFLTRWQVDMLLAGKKTFRVGKYKLLECIGAGGMGAVFKALHSEFGRIVAVKVLSADVMKNPQAVERFRQEMKAAAALDDPHIVVAYDAGEEGGCHYLVMEYFAGTNLNEMVRNGPAPIAWACECIRQAAMALQHAHEQGLVHRDIKPSNLLVATDASGKPTTKLLDLGLARFVSEMVTPESIDLSARHDDDSLTQVGQFLGTPDYISPEQARDTRSADIRSDIFSLGCTFFRILTGRLPFAGNTALEKLEARTTTPAVRARSIRPEIPKELDDVLARMLARDPDDRFQTPNDVAKALAHFANVSPSEQAISAPPPPAHVSEPARDDSRLDQILRQLAQDNESRQPRSLVRRRHWNRNQRLGALSTACAFMLCLVLYLIWQSSASAVWIVDWPTDERDGASLIINSRVIPFTNSDRITVRGKPGLWQLTLQRTGFEGIEVAAFLKRGERHEFTPQWKPTADAIRQSMFTKLNEQFAAARQNPLSIEAARSRQQMERFYRENSNSSEGAEIRRLLKEPRWPIDMTSQALFTLEERTERLPFFNDRLGRIVSLYGDESRRFWNGVSALAASRDGRWIAVASQDGTVRIYDTNTIQRVGAILPDQPASVLAFHPIEPLLAVGSETSSIELWNIETETRIHKLAGTSTPLAISDDGRWLACRSTRNEISLWQTTTGEYQRTLSGQTTGDLHGIVFSHRGSMLASYGSDRNVVVWDAANGQEPRRFSKAQYPLFSADDAFLASGTLSSDLILWDAHTGELQRVFDEGGYPISFHPDGSTLVSKRQGRAVVWSLETGEEIRTITEVPDLAIVSPDGNWLVGGDRDVSEIRIWNLQSERRERVVNTAGPVATVTFSSNSKTLFSGSITGEFEQFSVDSKMNEPVDTPSWGAADFTPDGSRLLVQVGGQFRSVDLATGQQDSLLSGRWPESEEIRISPDGRWLAGFGKQLAAFSGMGFSRKAFHVWNLETGAELTLMDIPPGNVRSVEFNPDSRHLAVAGLGHMVLLYNVVENRLESELEDLPDRSEAVAFRPKTEQLAVACRDKSILVFDLRKGGRREFESPGIHCRSLAFSPHGEILAGLATNRLILWNAATRKLMTELFAPNVELTSFAWNPLDSRIVASGNEGCLYFWSADSVGIWKHDADEPLRIGPPHGKIMRAVWYPDGRHIFTQNGNGTIAVVQIPNKP